MNTKIWVTLLGEHPRIVNNLLGPVTVHYREVLLYCGTRALLRLERTMDLLCHQRGWEGREVRVGEGRGGEGRGGEG